MDVQVTSKQQFLATQPDVLAMVAEFEKAIKKGVLHPPANGYGEHIRVHVEVPTWMQPVLEQMYEAGGWTVAYPTMDEVLLLI